jgi:hypothetical protein
MIGKSAFDKRTFHPRGEADFGKDQTSEFTGLVD